MASSPGFTGTWSTISRNFAWRCASGLRKRSHARNCPCFWPVSTANFSPVCSSTGLGWCWTTDLSFGFPSTARSCAPGGRSRSIQPGHKRGEACVSALAHRTEQVVGQTYYNGTKESERPAVRKLLNDSNLYSQKITASADRLDALHLVPKTLDAIHGAEGVYLIGLKSNQAHLYRYCFG